MSRRKQTSALERFQLVGQKFWDNVLKAIIITLTTTIIYFMFFPPIIVNLLDLTGTEGDLLVFPEISNVLDYYGLYAFIIYFIIQILLIRIFIQDNFVFFISAITAFITLGIDVLVGQWFYGLIAFQEGTTGFFETENSNGGTEFRTNFEISFLNLAGMIVLYDLIFILLMISLLRVRRKGEK